MISTETEYINLTRDFLEVRISNFKKFGFIKDHTMTNITYMTINELDVTTYVLPVDSYFMEGYKAINLIFAFIQTNKKLNPAIDQTDAALIKNDDKIFNEVILVFDSSDEEFDNNFSSYVNMVYDRMLRNIVYNRDNLSKNNYITRVTNIVTFGMCDNIALETGTKFNMSVFNDKICVTTSTREGSKVLTSTILKDIFGAGTYVLVLNIENKTEIQSLSKKLPEKTASDPLLTVHGVLPGWFVYIFTDGICPQQNIYYIV